MMRNGRGNARETATVPRGTAPPTDNWRIEPLGDTMLPLTYSRNASVLLVASLAITSGVAHAQPRTSSLSWTRLPGADSCAGPQLLARAVESRLRRDVFVSPARADLSVEGSIQPRSPSGWRAVVRVHDAKGELLGERELSTERPDCADLTEPLVLVIALMIDPDAALHATEPEPPASPEPPAPEPPAPAPPRVEVRRETVYVPVPVESPPRDTWQFEGGAGVASGLGHLPSPNVGAAASALLRPPGFWFLEAHGAAWHGSRVEAHATSARIARWEGGAALCPVASFESRGTYALCGGGQFALLTSQDHEGNSRTPQLIPEATAAFRGSLVLFDPFVIRVGLSALLPIRRVRVDSGEPPAEVFRSSWIAGVADLGIGLRL